MHERLTSVIAAVAARATFARSVLSRVALVVLGIVGCGGGPELAPVTGVVEIDGKPYPGGKVIFSPVAAAGEEVAGRSAFGVPDGSGRFSLSTFAPGDGALVGEHSVSFFRAADDRASRPDLASIDFVRVTLPGGRVRVEPGSNTIDVRLSRDDLRRFGNRK